MLNYFTLTIIAELSCLLVAIICLSKDNVRIWHYFSAFLLITVIAELTGIYLKRNHHPHNGWVYNILMVFEFAFINIMYVAIFRRYSIGKAIIISGFGLFALLYTYEFLKHGLFEYNNLSYTTMSIILVIYALFYYYDLMNNDNYIRIIYSAEFWWVTGGLFYYFGETACDLFYDKLQAVHIAFFHSLTYYIYNILNLLLYGCWSYSFICRKWLEKRSEIR